MQSGLDWSSGSQAQVWAVLPSFTVIVPWQSAPILPPELLEPALLLNPSVASQQMQLCREEGLSHTQLQLCSQLRASFSAIMKCTLQWISTQTNPGAFSAGFQEVLHLVLLIHSSVCPGCGVTERTATKYY